MHGEGEGCMVKGGRMRSEGDMCGKGGYAS